jgi:hypothetical protein
MDRAVAGAAPYVRRTAGDQVSSKSVKTWALTLGLFAAIVYVGYIAWNLLIVAG